MPSDQTLHRVKGVIRSCLKVDEKTPLPDNMPLIGGEYDLDSLDILLIVTQLEKEFGVEIKDGSMGKAAFANVEALAAFIESLPPRGVSGEG
jgi:acyl carrier protein